MQGLPLIAIAALIAIVIEVGRRATAGNVRTDDSPRPAVLALVIVAIVAVVAVRAAVEQHYEAAAHQHHPAQVTP